MRPNETRLLVALVAICSVLGFAATRSLAEAFVDVSAGVAMTRNADVTVRTAGHSQDVSGDFGTSVTAGGRFGYWFDALPWLGVAGTLSFYQPDVRVGTGVPRNDLTIVPLTAMVMARSAWMVSSEFPHGRLQPYAGVGPGVFIAAMSEGYSDTSTDVGLDFRSGMLFLLTPRIGVFTEYRFTHVTPTFKDRVNGQDVYRDTTIDDHQILGGISFHF
jgi:hypothetical protein